MTSRLLVGSGSKRFGVGEQVDPTSIFGNYVWLVYCRFGLLGKRSSSRFGEFVTECWQLSFLLYFFFLCFSSQLDLNRLVSQLVGFSIISSCWERKGDCILKCRIKLLNILLDTAPTPTWLLNISINVRTFNPKPKRRVEMPQCLQWLLYCSFGPGFLTSIIS